MIIELLTITLLLFAGVAALRIAGLTGWALLPLGYIVGMAGYVFVGSAQVMAGLPSYPAVTLGAVAVGTVAAIAVAHRRGRDLRLPWARVGLWWLGCAAVVVGLRAAPLVNWHIDSIVYIKAATLLADGTYNDAADGFLVRKRMLGFPLILAPARLGGEDFLHSAMPLLALAIMGTVAWLTVGAVRRGTATTVMAVLSIFGVALLLSNNRFVFHAFYLNGHLMAAAFGLLVAACGWLLVRGGRYPPAVLMTAQFFAIPALVLTRPEGFVIAAIAIFPMLVSSRVSMRHRWRTVSVWALTTAVSNAYAVVAMSAHGQFSLFSGVALWLILLGGIAALVAGLVWIAPLLLSHRWLTGHPKRSLWIAEAALLLMLAALTVRDVEVLKSSVRATITNAFQAEGSWGLSLTLLGLMVVATIVLSRNTDQIYLRFPVTTFLPVMFILAFSRGGAYRVGDYDSLNRMLVQILPLAVLFVVAALADQATRRGDEPTGAPSTDPAALPSETDEADQHLHGT